MDLNDSAGAPKEPRPSKPGNQRRRAARKAHGRIPPGDSAQGTALSSPNGGNLNNEMDGGGPARAKVDSNSPETAAGLSGTQNPQTQERKPQGARGRNRRRGKRSDHANKATPPDQLIESTSDASPDTADPPMSQVPAVNFTNNSAGDMVYFGLAMRPNQASGEPQVQAASAVVNGPSDRPTALQAHLHSPSGPNAVPGRMPVPTSRRQRYHKIQYAFPPEDPQDSRNFSAGPSQPVGKIIGPNAYSRPAPAANRRIYDPSQHPGLPPPSRDTIIPMFQQAQYLENVLAVQLKNVETPKEELLQAEAMRKDLVELCREAIAYYATQTNPDFDPMSVNLRAFGSLRAGFSLKSSDMDLALISPATEADPDFDDSTIPRLLETMFLSRGYGARLLTRTRVPILKLCEKPSEELLADLIAERIKSEEAKRAKELAAAEQTDGPSDSPSKLASDDGNSEERRAENVDTRAKGKAPEEHNNEDDSQKEPKGLRNRSNEDLLRLFALAISEGWYGPEDRELIAEFARCHGTAQGNAADPDLVQVRHQLRRLPDILSRYREPKETSVEIPKTGVGIQCDINFSNPLALHNTSLLRCYNLCDPRIKKLVLFIKAWAKRRDINTPYKGTLSSYGYVLMVLHYVVNIASPPLAPNLQQQLGQGRGGAPNVPRTCNGYNVQFWRDENKIELAAKRNQINYSKESLGSLLRGFFSYFAEQGPPNFVPRGGFCWGREILSLRTEGGILTKEAKGWTGARTDMVEGANGEKPVEVRQRYLFAIEDPFETDHNVARPVVHGGICAIRDEFRRANRIIKCGGVIDGQSHDLFAECKHAELDREQRFFGPNPGNAPRPKFSGPRAGEASNAGRKISGNAHKSSGMPKIAPKETQEILQAHASEAKGKQKESVGMVMEAGPSKGRVNSANLPAEATGPSKKSNLQVMREQARRPNEELVAAGLIGIDV
ncbi:MAG: hypothetical protein MMC23_000190 [Stictis urceolatum]|nr:hypothetical protein [Stictis urceolata]